MEKKLWTTLYVKAYKFGFENVQQSCQMAVLWWRFLQMDHLKGGTEARADALAEVQTPKLLVYL